MGVTDSSVLEEFVMDLNYDVVNLELRSFSKGEYHARLHVKLTFLFLSLSCHFLSPFIFRLAIRTLKYFVLV